MKKYRLAVLTSHTIQYQGPLFKEVALHPDIDLTVYFCWDFGVSRKTYDTGFGKEIKWDVPLLGGYRYKFLSNFSLKPSSEFWGQINLGIIKELWGNKYDAILIFGWNSLTNWLAFLTAFLVGVPVLLRAENPFIKETIKRPLKIKIKKIVLGWLFRRVSAFLYLGHENKKFYEYYGAAPGKLIFCPYAVDNQRFIAASKEQGVNRKSYRKDLGIGDKDVAILFLGKLMPIKRPMDLLKAYDKLIRGLRQTPKSSQGAALLFVGDGILRKELESYAKEHDLENVHFLGFKNQTELPKYYVLADILVLPSDSETWGIVVNEAMCFGLPLIVSDMVGSAPDLVKGGQNGYIFSVGDIDRLTSYLEELVNNSSRRELFGQRSFDIVRDYSYGNDIKGILAAFTQIIDR